MRLKWKIAAILTGFFLFQNTLKAADEEFELYSPDNNLKVTVILQDGDLSYKVDKNNIGIIETSKLGIITNRGNLDSGLTYSSQHTAVIDESYSLPAGKRSVYHNYCNELRLDFTHSVMNMSVIFRAYNDGCAFRYHLPDHPDNVTVTAESTQIHYSSFEGSWGMKWSKDYSEYFEPRTWAQIRALPQRRVAMPFLTKHGENYCLLSEAANYGTYAASSLIADDSSTTLFAFAPAGTSTGVPSSGNISIDFPFYSPWRVMMIGSLPTIVESSMVEHLNPPAGFIDWSWIIPGRASWDWGGEHTQNKNINTNLTYIDLAARMGWEYTLIDDGWNDSQVTTIMNRANKNGVKIFLWFNNSQFPKDKAGIKTILQKYKNQGVVGVKIDFWENDNQATMQKYDNFMEAAMEVKMMVNFHGCTKPSGLRRRWPHLMTTEAVLGGEFYIQNSNMPPVYDNINLTFTRNVIGSMDYTPVEFANPTRGEGGITRINTSWAHQVALSVAYESAMQVFLDSPENYDNNISLEFLKRVPARWDDTKCLEALPNQYSTIVRKNGEDWYLGALCNNARKLDISLDFLEEGVYYAHIYKDGNCKTVIDFELRQVQKTDRLTIPMLQGGGAAIHFTKNPSMPVPQNIIVEAEADGNVYGGNAKKIADVNASGGYRIGNLGNDLKSYLTINVDVPEEGTYAMSVFYCTSERRKVYVSVNDKKREAYYFSNKEGANNCSRLNMRTINVFLQKGHNTVKFINENDYMPDFDRCSFIKTSLATVTPQTEPDYVLSPYDITKDGGVLTAQYHNETLTNLTDNNVQTKYIVNNPQGEFWIRYETKVPVVLTGYALCPAGDKPECDPVHLQLDGSDDGTNWKLIHNNRNQSFDRLETRVYSIWNERNIKPYKYFKLTIKSLNGGPDFQLAEWQLYGYKTEMPKNNVLEDPTKLTAQFEGEVYNLMDNAYNTKYTAKSDNSSGWIMYDQGASQTIVSYGLQNTVNTNRHNDPCTWELQGSNNRSSWIVLDRREEVVFMVPLHQLFFKTQKPLPFRYIRLNIFDTKSGKPVELSGWQLYLTNEAAVETALKQNVYGSYNVWVDSGELHLEGTEKTVYNIFNILGTPVAGGIFDKMHTINNLSKGIYLVSLGWGKEHVVKKLVI